MLQRYFQLNLQQFFLCGRHNSIIGKKSNSFIRHSLFYRFPQIDSILTKVRRRLQMYGSV